MALLLMVIVLAISINSKSGWDDTNTLHFLSHGNIFDINIFYDLIYQHFPKFHHNLFLFFNFRWLTLYD